MQNNFVNIINQYNYKFGCEFEFSSEKSGAELNGLFNSETYVEIIGNGLTYSSRNSNTYLNWKLTYDSSVQIGNKKGYELVSPILDSSKYNKTDELYAICNMLTNFNLTHNENHGGHIHISHDGLSNITIRKIIDIYEFNQDHIDILLPVIRTADDNKYIRHKTSYHVYGASKSISTSKYSYINITSKTIEFRQNGATFNVEGFVSWISILFSIIDTAKSEDISPYVKYDTPIEFLQNINVDKNVLLYLSVLIHKRNSNSKDLLGDVLYNKIKKNEPNIFTNIFNKVRRLW